MRSFSGESDAYLKNASLHVTVVWQQGLLPRVSEFSFYLFIFSGKVQLPGIHLSLSCPV